MKKKKNSISIFVIAFIFILAITFVGNMFKRQIVLLEVSGNAGMGQMETVAGHLVVGFQDGQICTWDWSSLLDKQGDFAVNTNRFAILNKDQLAAIPKTGKKTLTVHQLPSGQSIKQIEAGFDDQDIWPKAYADRGGLALIRKNPVRVDKVTYEFLTVDIETELLSIPTTLTIDDKTETLVDFEAGSGSKLYAIGGKEGTGRVIALDLQKRSVLWDQTHVGTQEYCSIILSPDGQYLLAGNRDGLLYKLDSATGEILTTIKLLEEGETRPVTNDYSVLNPAFSPDGQLFAVTINPKVYVMKMPSFEIVHVFSPADRVVSKVAFSPDNRQIATSDVRAGYPIKIWQLPQEKK